MNKKFYAIAGALALTAAGVAGVSSIGSAEAQNAQKAPIILIVDMQQVVAQTDAGKTIPDQAKKVQASVVKELEAEVAKLQKDIENFQKNSSLMADDVRKKTEQELAMRSQYGLPQQEQIMSQALKISLQNAQNKILQESQPILNKIVEDRGATVLLDRSAVLYASVDTDVTQEVISEINKKMKTVEVKKVSLAEIEKQIREAQAKAAAEQGKKK